MRRGEVLIVCAAGFAVAAMPRALRGGGESRKNPASGPAQKDRVADLQQRITAWRKRGSDPG